MKTVFIPITEEMLILHPIRTVHEDLRNDVEKIESFINRICQYIWINGELTTKYWKIKGYVINKTEDGTVVLVSYKQAVNNSEFPVPERNSPALNTSPLPQAMHSVINSKEQR